MFDLPSHLGQLLDHLEARARDGPPVIDPVPPIRIGLGDAELELGPGVWLIVGAAGSGRSALAHLIALQGALRAGVTTTYITAAEPGSAVCRRWIARLGGIPMHRMDTGLLDPADWRQVADCIRALTEAPLGLIEAVGSTLANLVPLLDLMNELHDDRQLIVIDPLERFGTPVQGADLLRLPTTAGTTLVCPVTREGVQPSLARAAAGVVELADSSSGLVLRLVLDRRDPHLRWEIPVVVRLATFDLVARPSDVATRTVGATSLPLWF